MTRKQRALHRAVWSVLLVAFLAIFGMALIVRERVSEVAAAARQIGRG